MRCQGQVPRKASDHSDVVCYEQTKSATEHSGSVALLHIQEWNRCTYRITAISCYINTAILNIIAVLKQYIVEYNCNIEICGGGGVTYCFHWIFHAGVPKGSDCTFLLVCISRFAGKPEALKAFQCASTVKAVVENIGKSAGVAFADILEAVWRFFTSLRSE